MGILHVAWGGEGGIRCGRDSPLLGDNARKLDNAGEGEGREPKRSQPLSGNPKSGRKPLLILYHFAMLETNDGLPFCCQDIPQSELGPIWLLLMLIWDA